MKTQLLVPVTKISTHFMPFLMIFSKRIFRSMQIKSLKQNLR
jgi:hypothetical protein